LAFACTVLVLGLTAATGTAQSQQTQAPPEKKTEAPAPSVAGKWDVWVQTEQGGMGSTLDLKLEGKKVTGTIASERGTSPVEGEFADGKLQFWFTMQGNGGSMQIAFSGAFKEDGSLAGTIDVQGYQLPWTATRSKAGLSR
jgi:hypothetical protein